MANQILRKGIETAGEGLKKAGRTAVSELLGTINQSAEQIGFPSILKAGGLTVLNSEEENRALAMHGEQDRENLRFVRRELIMQKDPINLEAIRNAQEGGPIEPHVATPAKTQEFASAPSFPAPEVPSTSGIESILPGTVSEKPPSPPVQNVFNNNEEVKNSEVSAQMMRTAVQDLRTEAERLGHPQNTNAQNIEQQKEYLEEQERLNKKQSRIAQMSEPVEAVGLRRGTAFTRKKSATRMKPPKSLESRAGQGKDT